MKRFRLAFIFGVFIATSTALAQTDRQLTLRPWPDGVWGETNDHPIFQAESHVKGEDANAQIFWWDSTGRFRLSGQDPKALDIGYRWATINFDTNSARLPDHLDELSAAVGVHIGDNVTFIGGAGYSGRNPFADDNGVFGIGHVTWQKSLNSHDTLVLSLDYDGNASLLPDVPLPGFAFVHRDEPISFGVGYPESWVQWHIMPKLTFEARYAVPYTAYGKVEYELNNHFSVFVDGANFYNGFAQDNAPATDRLFFQMAQTELGVRYRQTWREIYIDVAVVGGYAFEQRFSHGWDVRDLDSVATLSDEPYIGIVLIGRF